MDRVVGLKMTVRLIFRMGYRLGQVAFGHKRTLTNLILQSLMFTRRFRVDFIDEFIE